MQFSESRCFEEKKSRNSNSLYIYSPFLFLIFRFICFQKFNMFGFPHIKFQSGHRTQIEHGEGICRRHHSDAFGDSMALYKPAAGQIASSI